MTQKCRSDTPPARFRSHLLHIPTSAEHQPYSAPPLLFLFIVQTRTILFFLQKLGHFKLKWTNFQEFLVTNGTQSDGPDGPTDTDDIVKAKGYVVWENVTQFLCYCLCAFRYEVVLRHTPELGRPLENKNMPLSAPCVRHSSYGPEASMTSSLGHLLLGPVDSC